MSELSDVFSRYAAYITAGDVDGILSLYAPEAKIQIPVGGPVHEGIAAQPIDPTTLLVPDPSKGNGKSHTAATS